MIIKLIVLTSLLNSYYLPHTNEDVLLEEPSVNRIVENYKDILESELKTFYDESQTLSNVFHFDPERFGIVQGVVSDAVALKNKEIIQNVIDKVGDYGVNTLVIDEMDCYISVGGIWSLGEGTLEDGISLPSNFTLQMTSNTFIRVQPNKWPRYNVLNTSQKDNVQIIGGNIIGDRYTHDYSPRVH